MEPASRPRTRKRPNSDGRQEQIVEAALQVMIAEGVHNTTTRKIAESAGVNVGTLHYHFHDKEEIIFSAMESLASGYRDTLSRQFSRPQPLGDRIGDLLRFICSEIEKTPGEQMVLQEMTLYVLRVPYAKHMAARKELEIKSLYFESLQSSSDVDPQDEMTIRSLTDFIYSCFVGILNQWLATQDSKKLHENTEDLIHAARFIATEKLTNARKS